MYRFLESICFSAGSYHLLDYHQERLNGAFSKFFPKRKPFQLDKILPKLSGTEKKKVRIEYDGESFEVGVSNYTPKSIAAIKLIEGNDIDYSFKYAERGSIDELMNLRLEADDILIVRNQKITDCSYANVIFRDENGWVTPKSFLLNGVKRQKLLQAEVIREAEITINNLSQYSEISLINAMLDPEEISLPVNNILR